MQNTKKVAFYTLGCKLNFSETATLSRNFQEEGFEKVNFEEKADIYVVNTCSVTENADKRFKTIVKQALKKNEKAFLIAVGCYAQLKPSELAEIEGVDLVLGAKEKFNITQYLQELSKDEKTQVHACEIAETNFYESAYSTSDRTRAFLKIQDGCDYPCTYCTIPLARGKSRSDTIQNVVLNAENIAKKGIKEIVLTGVNIGDFGKINGTKKRKETFFELLKALEKIKAIARFRISSIEPNLLKDEMIDFIANSEKFVPHFHIPLQSGSDVILKKMKRKYLTKLYTARIEKIKNLMPDACIGVDVIVGFPGETDDLFLETYDYLNHLEIAYLHVFSYSEREHTPAAKMQKSVLQKIRHKRSKMLRGLSAKKKRFFYEKMLGKEQKVLFENENKKGYLQGFTENYVKVKTPWKPHLANTLQKIKLTKIDTDGLVRFE